MMLFFAFLTIFTTLLGGYFAIRSNGRHRALFGLSAGIILSVVFFDIFPEIISLSQKTGIEIKTAMLWILTGLLLFHIFEKYILIHHADESEEHHGHKHAVLGMSGASALIFHSFLDGMGIGFGFQISTEIGVAMAFAVLAHNFADGINTVSLMMGNKNNTRRTMIFLITAALAPLIGAITTLFFVISEKYMLIYLGLFAGFLLYISLSHVLPEAHAEKSSWKSVLATLFGIVVMYFILGFIA